MFSALNHVGFNITKNKLQLVEVVKEASKFCLENVDEESFENGFDFNSNESNFINILQSALNEFTNRNPLKSKNISFALPFSEFKIFEIPFDSSLSSFALKEHLKWEFTILFPTLNKNDYIIRSLQLASVENMNKLLVVALSKNIANAIFKFSTQNNLLLRFIDSSHFSADAVIDKVKSLSIFIEDDNVSIASYLNNGLHTIKKKSTIGIDTVVEEVEKFVDEQNIAYEKIFISGTEEVDELKIALEEKLNIAIKMFNPFESIETSETFIQNGHFLNKPNTFTAAAGICYRKF